MEDYQASEQLEEGEIIDDDDFEDISDNSITDSTFGKFVSPNENLRALSLSSDSEVELQKNLKRRKKLLYRKNKIKHQKRRKRPKLSSDSSDSDISPCRDLKGKLKEAIHISGIEEGQRNPLETRLKGMWGLLTNKEPVTIAPEPPPLVEDKKNSDKVKDNNIDDKVEDKIDDHELENLRIEALKTAVLNKFQRRKRKKAISDQQTESKPSEILENKENDTPKDGSNCKNKNDNIVEVKAVTLDIEEDEDVLRASLLAGLAKKITKVSTNENYVNVKPVPPKLPVHIASVLPKQPINNSNNKNCNTKSTVQTQLMPNRLKPQVKPLIINVNDDSDSEEEVKEKTVPVQKVADLKVITNSVEKFLKEQRAKFETETKKRFQIVHKNKSILEKSAVKLLPKSQQIEYQQLLKKLKTAEKRKRAKKLALQKLKSEAVNINKQAANEQPLFNTEISSKSSETNVCINQSFVKDSSSDKVLKVETTNSDVQVNSSDEQPQQSEDKNNKRNSVEMKMPGVTNELTTLQRALKEIKMQRNGSLQIKSKYQVLTPIIRKITAASNERKKNEQRIKKLLQELNEARNSLANSHEKFSALVRELVDKKEKIDVSSEDSSGRKKIQNHRVVRKCSEECVIDHSKMSAKNLKCYKRDVKPLPTTSTPIKQSNTPIVEEAIMSTITTSSLNNDCEDMDVCLSDETDMCQIDIVDPNDIDQIFKRKSINKVAIPEYVSPLNLNACERYKHLDPLGIMCPYEVNGSCRDSDCTFKHYLKSED